MTHFVTRACFYVTKSKSGHYSLTLSAYDGDSRVLRVTFTKLDSLHRCDWLKGECYRALTLYMQGGKPAFLNHVESLGVRFHA